MIAGLIEHRGHGLVPGRYSTSGRRDVTDADANRELADRIGCVLQTAKYRPHELD